MWLHYFFHSVTGFCGIRCCHSTNMKQVLPQFSELVTGQIFKHVTPSRLLHFCSQ